MRTYYFFISFVLLLISVSQAQELITVYNGSTTIKSCLLVGDILYFSEGSKVQKIDITNTNPTAIEILGSLDNPVGLEHKDGFLYVAVFYEGEIIKIDVSNSASNPQLVTVGYTPNMLKFYGDYLYYSDSNEFAIYRINIADPNAVSESFVSNISGGPIGLDVKGNELYYTEALEGKIHKINLSNPNAVPIEVISGLNLPAGIEFKGDYLYIADALDGKILKANVTVNPLVLEEVLDNLSVPRDITFNGNTMYVVHDSKISRIDLSLGIEEEVYVNEINLFPNPTQDYVQFTNLNNPSKYTIYDIHGRDLKNGVVVFEEKIDISNFASGNYLIQLEGTSFPLRFIKY